jgi:hypothetical protein
MPASKSEIEALWRELFGGPPPVDAAPEMLLDVLVRCLPQPTPYGYAPEALSAPPAALVASPPRDD